MKRLIFCFQEASQDGPSSERQDQPQRYSDTFDLHAALREQADHPVMTLETGNISVHRKNIFRLFSDREISQRKKRRVF